MKRHELEHQMLPCSPFEYSTAVDNQYATSRPLQRHVMRFHALEQRTNNQVLHYRRTRLR